MAVEKILVEAGKYANLLNVAQHAMACVFADAKKVLDEHEASKQKAQESVTPPSVLIR